MKYTLILLIFLTGCTAFPCGFDQVNNQVSDCLEETEEAGNG